MDWTFTRERGPELLVVRVSGDFSVSGFARMLDEVASLPWWTPRTNALVDYTAASLAESDFATIASVTDAESARRNELGSGQVALVVGDDLTYGLARAYQTISEGKIDTTVAIFRTESEARSWLGSRDDRATPA